MLLGQSAAKAACLAIDNNIKVQQVDVAAIQRMYEEDPLLDGSTPDIILDDVDVITDGDSAWKRVVAANGYGRSYYVLKPSSKVERLRYNLKVKDSGQYRLYTYHIRRNASSRKMYLDVVSGGERKEVVVDSDNVKILGQTSGMWVEIGNYELKAGQENYVEFSNKGDVSGEVVADAILAVKNR